MRILIADDDAISRQMLEAALTKWGYEVVGTDNGDDALVVLQAQDAPLLAILDVMMPGIEGGEVCRRVRQMEQVNPTYIILLSAKDTKAEVVKGLHAGADEYLTKPFDPDELYARVQVGMRVVQLQRSLAGRVLQLERAEAKLSHLSRTDDLTGLFNRRGFLTSATRHLKLARRTRKECLLVYADMDGLKQINDNLGHEEGSLAITRVAEVLRQSFRDTDLIARLGGDEFVILAIDAARDAAQSIKGHLEENLQKAGKQFPRPYELSLSVGSIWVEPDTANSVEDLINQADRLMYAHKRAKRQIGLSSKDYINTPSMMKTTAVNSTLPGLEPPVAS